MTSTATPTTARYTAVLDSVGYLNEAGDYHAAARGRVIDLPVAKAARLIALGAVRPATPEDEARKATYREPVDPYAPPPLPAHVQQLTAAETARAKAESESIREHSRRQLDYGRSVLKRAHDQRRSPWAVLSDDADDDPALDKLGGLLDALAERGATNQERRERAEAEQRRRMAARQQAQEIIAEQEARRADEFEAAKAARVEALTDRLLANESR